MKRGGALVLVEHRAFSSVTAQLLGALGELVGEEGVAVGESGRHSGRRAASKSTPSSLWIQTVSA